MKYYCAQVLHDNEEAEGCASIPGAGPPAPHTPPLYRPQYPHSHPQRLPKRRQVQLHEPGEIGIQGLF